MNNSENVNMSILSMMELHLMEILDDGVTAVIIDEDQASWLSEKIYAALDDISETIDLD